MPLQVTTQLLVETQAGKKVRKLTKHGNAAIAQAAAATVAAWKEAVAQEATRHGNTGAGLTICSLDRERTLHARAHELAQQHPYPCPATSME